MQIDIFLQRILWQAHRVYEWGMAKDGSAIDVGPNGNFGRYAQCSELYDFLIKDEHPIDFSPEIKKEMYRVAIIIFNREQKRIAASPEISDDRKKAEVVKYYKSLLVRQYLLNKFADTGEKIVFHDENGNKILRIDLK